MNGFKAPRGRPDPNNRPKTIPARLPSGTQFSLMLRKFVACLSGGGGGTGCVPPARPTPQLGGLDNESVKRHISAASPEVQKLLF